MRLRNWHVVVDIDGDDWVAGCQGMRCEEKG